MSRRRNYWCSRLQGWPLVVLPFMIGQPQTSLANQPQTMGHPSTPARFQERLHLGWKACRLPPGVNPAWGCSSFHDSPAAAASSATASATPAAAASWTKPLLLNVTTLPTTALIVLLDNQQIPGLEEMRSDDLYRSTNLALLPDIAKVGRSYYTLTYEIDLTQQSVCRMGRRRRRRRRGTHLAQHPDQSNSPRTSLCFAGINYRALAFLDGTRLWEIPNDGSDSDGMFRRRCFDVSSVCGNNNKKKKNNTADKSTTGRFHIVIEPPLHPGTCHRSSASPVDSCQGQGGDHSLAIDGATAQYMLGWDWAQSMPDRATGFYGAVHLQRTAGSVTIYDPAIRTKSLRRCTTSTKTAASATTAFANVSSDKLEWQCLHIVLEVMARIECTMYPSNDESSPSSPCQQGNTGRLVVQSDWGEIWEFKNISLGPGNTHLQKEIVVRRPHHVQLWWPHGVGIQKHAHLHRISFSFDLNEMISDQTFINVGIRTVDTYLDKKLQGQTFRINGKRIYLVGGNWIGTDQALRFSASRGRYCHELALHKHAGLNLIRVWGGSTAERDDFYECADMLGLLVYQEFWMTGDNNGRWAGEYSWPLDRTAYLANVQDTVLRLRSHPSLLFYGGCNECLAPLGLSNPPEDIDQGTRQILAQFDPGRFYISSSMSGRNVADVFSRPTQWYNRSYSLAFADGPYGMQFPHIFFERNPGLVYKNISIGFQPELGSASVPTYQGLLRFMNESEIDQGYPRKNDTSLHHKVWDFHRFQGWVTSTSNVTYDHVYAYFADNQQVHASDWCAAAQLAAHSQYQHLFNGFISYVYSYTTAVILWKSQSPWPALRGFLYDWYLESTGALRGVRAALGDPISIVLDALTLQMRIINRRVEPILSKRARSIGARFEWISLEGKIVDSGHIFLESNSSVPPMSAIILGENRSAVEWPAACSDVCFLGLQPVSVETQSTTILGKTSWYWLTPAGQTQNQAERYNFSALGALRDRRNGCASLVVHDCIILETETVVHAQILVSGDEIFFYPTLRLVQSDGSPLLPVFDEKETDVVLTPGYNYSRELRSPMVLKTPAIINVILEGWNGRMQQETIKCQYEWGESLDDAGVVADYDMS